MTYTQPLLPVLFLLGAIGLVWNWKQTTERKPTLLALAFLGLFFLVLATSRMAWYASP